MARPGCLHRRLGRAAVVPKARTGRAGIWRWGKVEGMLAETRRRLWTGPPPSTCVLALAWPDGEYAIYEGRCDGALTWPPRGTLGFGYDPVFVPTGSSQTFAEIAPEEKTRHQPPRRRLCQAGRRAVSPVRLRLWPARFIFIGPSVRRNAPIATSTRMCGRASMCPDGRMRCSPICAPRPK